MSAEGQLMFRDEDSVDSVLNSPNAVYPSLVYPIGPKENSVSYLDIIGTFFSILGKRNYECLCFSTHNKNVIK